MKKENLKCNLYDQYNTILIRDKKKRLLFILAKKWNNYGKNFGHNKVNHISHLIEKLSKEWRQEEHLTVGMNQDLWEKVTKKILNIYI